MLLNWKSIFIGLGLAIVLYILLKIISGTTGSFLGIITASIIAGYISSKDLTNGAIHGAIIGAIGGISLEIFTIIGAVTIGETTWTLTTLGHATIIESIIIWVGLGIMGSTIGAMMMKGSPEMETVEKGSIVALNMENLQKCACSHCQVQAESKCVQNKIYMLKEMMKMEKDIMPEPGNIPKMYCSTGITTCSDLNINKMCNCPNCEVFKENRLKYGEKTAFFCMN